MQFIQKLIQSYFFEVLAALCCNTSHKEARNFYMLLLVSNDVLDENYSVIEQEFMSSLHQSSHSHRKCPVIKKSWKKTVTCG